MLYCAQLIPACVLSCISAELLPEQLAAAPLSHEPSVPTPFVNSTYTQFQTYLSGPGCFALMRRGALFVKRILLAHLVLGPVTNSGESNRRTQVPKLSTFPIAAVKPGCSLKCSLAVAAVTALPRQ